MIEIVGRTKHPSSRANVCERGDPGKIITGWPRRSAPRHYALATLLLILLFPSLSFADNLKQSIDILYHGSKFQTERVKVAAENLANEDSTATSPGGNPYTRKVIVPKNKYDKRLKSNILIVKKIDKDKSPFPVRYQPGHPAADANGYVKLPNVSKEIERADALEAQRSYEASLAMIEISKGMIDKTIEVMKGN